MRSRSVVFRSLALTLLVATAGCGAPEAAPAGQLLVWVTTDAPVPESSLRSNAPPPLFDRLLIDFYPPTLAECSKTQASCELPTSRQIAVDVEQFGADGLSFGVALPAHVAGYSLRARLYSAALASGKLPPPGNVIDRLVSLPSVPAEGAPISIAIVLRVDELGREVDPRQPEAPTLGRPPTGLVGTWPGARRVPCAGAPRAGEVCVPGGAFWMGLVDRIEGPLALDVPSARLVQLSPFFMQETEVTVQSLRDSGLAKAADPRNPADLGDPIGWDPNPALPWHYGTWAADDVADWPFEAPAREMPVAGITKQLAEAYCHSRGAELPSEAQFEYVSGGLENRMYIWGNDDPSCDDAVWGRAGGGILTAFWGDCRAPGDETGGPRPPRSGERDVLALDDGKIHDIAGNLLEWTRDVWNRQDQLCWSPPQQTDPVCQETLPDQAVYTVRGGGWPLVAAAMRPQSRLGLDQANAWLFLPAIGFRCVRPG